MNYIQLTHIEYETIRANIERGGEFEHYKLFGENATGDIVKIKAKSVLQCPLGDRKIYREVR